MQILFLLLFNVLWNRFLWVVWAAIAWLLEACAAVVLAPISLPASLLGVRRHRLVAVSKDGAEDIFLSQGSWYTVRRARADAWDRVAADDGVLVLYT